MKIHLTNKINFRAEHLTSPFIEKYNVKKKEYTPVQVAFVQIEPGSKEDVVAVSRAVHKWKDDDFGIDILKRLRKIRFGALNEHSHKIYALTSQQNDFHHLEPENILGLAEFIRKPNGKRKLQFLQVKPEFKSSSCCLGYQHIGQTIIENLQQMKDTYDILTKSFYKSTGFYEKMGFDLIDPKNLLYRWKKF